MTVQRRTTDVHLSLQAMSPPGASFATLPIMLPDALPALPPLKEGKENDDVDGRFVSKALIRWVRPSSSRCSSPTLTLRWSRSTSFCGRPFSSVSIRFTAFCRACTTTTRSRPSRSSLSTSCCSRWVSARNAAKSPQTALHCCCARVTSTWTSGSTASRLMLSRTTLGISARPDSRPEATMPASVASASMRTRKRLNHSAWECFTFRSAFNDAST
mmetsp:Transcript_98111/g.277490  ORF Transcript_98111/g.277490 Transcript_98111/m.277490 type:complete len:215 (+) Transcript_98111:129-773(+)